MNKTIAKENNRGKLEKLLHKCGRDMYFHSSYGIRQTDVLMLLREGPKTQKEIQTQLDISPATISELISKLESKGFVTREKSENDRRVVLLSLTKLGKDEAEKRLKEASGFKVGVPLSDEEIDYLIVLLEKLDAAFTAKDEADKSTAEE